MFFDLIILVIIVLSLAFGYRKGFIYTLIHATGWLVAIVGAYLLTPGVASFLREKTGVYDAIFKAVAHKFDMSLQAIDITLESMPKSAQPDISTHSTNIVTGVADGFAEVFILLLVFLALFILLKLALWLLLRLLSKEYNDGAVGGIDGIFGGIFGFLRGVLLVLVLLAAFLPLTNLFSLDLAEAMTKALDQSFFAKALYDNNPLLILLENSSPF